MILKKLLYDIQLGKHSARACVADKVVKDVQSNLNHLFSFFSPIVTIQQGINQLLSKHVHHLKHILKSH
jgi:hypothetical protein